MRKSLSVITSFFKTASHRKRPLVQKLRDESGIGTIEMILLLVVLIALVLLFKEHIKNLLETIMEQISLSSSKVWS